MDDIINIKIKLYNNSIKGLFKSYREYKFNIENFIINEKGLVTINNYIDKLFEHITINNIDYLNKYAFNYGYFIGKIFYFTKHG